MKTTAADLEHRALLLPPDYEKYVIERHGASGKVKSFSSDTIWSVHIQRSEKEGDLEATCTCPATRVCHHIVAYFAISKGLGPVRDKHKEGLHMIAEAVQEFAVKLTEGISLIAMDKITKEVELHAKDKTT